MELPSEDIYGEGTRIAWLSGTWSQPDWLVKGSDGDWYSLCPYDSVPYWKVRDLAGRANPGTLVIDELVVSVELKNKRN